jgi:hypothetical protein
VHAAVFIFQPLELVGVYRDYKFRNKVNYFKNYSQLRPPKKQAAATWFQTKSKSNAPIPPRRNGRYKVKIYGTFERRKWVCPNRKPE